MSRRSMSPLPVAAWGAAALVSFLFVSGCSQRESAFEPLRDAPSGPVVSGQVRDGQGAAMADAVVTLEPIVAGMTARVRERIQAERRDAYASLDGGDRAAVRSTVSDARGRFAFAGVSPGAYLVTGSRRDHLAGIERVDVPTAVTAETTFVDLALTPTGSFYGTVTLENATDHQSTVVYVQGTSFVAVTNPSGVYTISGVPVGSWTVRATHPGYIDGSTGGAIAAAGDSIALSSMQLLLNSNINPVASASTPAASFVDVPTPLTGSGSDDDGSVVRYEWDFENDGVFDYSSFATASTSHEYPSAGTYVAKLRVTDNLGAIGHDAVSVNVLDAVFVSATTGNNANPGTKAQPVATIGQGLTVAVGQGVANVLVAAGTYNESPIFLNGRSVRGGYDATTWVTPSGTTTVQVGTTAATANSITTATTISRLRIVASNAPAGQSSIALRSVSSSSQLVFEDCTFQAGNAGATVGVPAPGVPGPGGGNGNPGSPGNCDGPQGGGGGGGSSVAGCPGGIGGSGGAPGSNNGSFGTVGGCSGGSPGPGGAFGDPGATGVNGTAGANGADGTGGTPGSNAGTVVGGVWTPLASGAGVSGLNGRGGGGGGGGGAQDVVFAGDGGGNGGGGGGGGGGLGTGGGGGFGGHASFAVYLFDSSPVLLRGTYVSGSGGAGGAGANGGTGGNGGSGGAGAANCTSEVGRGGNGGAGGRGGHGGGGAGGPGGPSYAIWREGTSAPSIVSTVSSTIGIGGAGGNGGLSGGPLPPASPGPSGLSGVVH